MYVNIYIYISMHIDMYRYKYVDTNTWIMMSLLAGGPSMANVITS